MIEYERGAGFLGCHVEDNKEKNKRHRVMYGCKRLNLELKTWLTEVSMKRQAAPRHFSRASYHS